MSKPFALILFTSLLVFACNKNKDDNAPLPLNTWKLGNNSFTASKIVVNGPMLIATNDSQTVSVTFKGSGLPQVSGNIGVNNDGLSVAGCVGTNPTTDLYYSTGTDNITATYSVSNNKIAIAVPSVWAKNLKGDSLQLSANLAQ